MSHVSQKFESVLDMFLRVLSETQAQCGIQEERLEVDQDVELEDAELHARNAQELLKRATAAVQELGSQVVDKLEEMKAQVVACGQACARIIYWQGGRPSVPFRDPAPQMLRRYST